MALVRESLPGLIRMTIGSLIVLDVHAKDVTEQLIQSKTTSMGDFNWIFRLRYYLET